MPTKLSFMINGGVGRSSIITVWELNISDSNLKNWTDGIEEGWFEICIFCDAKLETDIISLVSKP